MHSPKKSNWSWETKQDKRIYKHRAYHNMHVTVYFNGDYHSTHKNRHFGYVNNRFQISGGKQSRELFFQFEEDVKSERIPLPSMLKMNIKIKNRRECDKRTPVEDFVINQTLNGYLHDDETKRKKRFSKNSPVKNKTPIRSINGRKRSKKRSADAHIKTSKIDSRRKL